jgi:hypothetical protein
VPDIAPHNSPPELHRRLMLWTVICGVSAAPSFIWTRMAGNPDFDVAAMITGVVIVIIIYTWATGTEFVARLQARPRAARALRIGYLVRLFLSALFPLGMGVDLIPGVLSGLVVNLLSGGALENPAQSGSPISFPFTLSITLVQGLFLNLIGFAFMGIVYGLLPRRLDSPDVGLCQKCGYDLRASYEFGRCPECGTPCTPPPEWEDSIPLVKS